MPKKTSFKKTSTTDSREKRLREWLGDDDALLVKKLYNWVTGPDLGYPETEEQTELIAFGTEMFAAEIAKLRLKDEEDRAAYLALAATVWDQRVKLWTAAGHTLPDGSVSTNPNDWLLGHYPRNDGRACGVALCPLA